VDLCELGKQPCRLIGMTPCMPSGEFGVRENHVRARDTLSGIAAFLPRSGLCILWAALFGGLLRAEDLRSQEFMTEAREGFARIYNLDYREASETFLRLKRRYPGHPAPPLYLATVIWLQELFERNELDLDNFIAPAYFTEPTASKMGAEQRRALPTTSSSVPDSPRTSCGRIPGTRMPVTSWEACTASRAPFRSP